MMFDFLGHPAKEKHRFITNNKLHHHATIDPEVAYSPGPRRTRQMKQNFVIIRSFNHRQEKHRPARSL